VSLYSDHIVLPLNYFHRHFVIIVCHVCTQGLFAYSPFQVVIRALNSVAWIALREWELGTAGGFAELALESM
jgi:hypothetical protein